ncbi:hypothetical protein Alg130_07790 [Pyrenophora tritici-repentis]|nr:hypothetical protein Alg130_07790 [Pyrenophora tritici-repentis]
MSSIYHTAEFVISAQSAANVHEGFLDLGCGVNAPSKRVEVPFCMPDGTSRTIKLSIRRQQKQYFEVPAHHSGLAMDAELVPLKTAPG